MKLTPTQVETIEHKTGLKPLPEATATEAGLADAFGDQTFYVDPNGVYVFESVESPSGEEEPVMAIQIARVEPAEGGDDAVTVRAIQPKGIELTVDLAS